MTSSEKTKPSMVFDTNEIVPIVPDLVNKSVFSFNLNSLISHFVRREIYFSALG